jgi:protease I
MSKKILILVACDYEDMELQYPKFRLLEAGHTVHIAGKKKDETYTGKKGYPCKADIDFDAVKVDDYDALVIPGGQAPDTLRTIPKVLEITRQFHEKKKVIAFICHAGWVPISAKVIKGVRSTSYGAIKDDMINAGADWVDEPVVVDGHFVSSRCPDDLPKFLPAILKLL